MGLRTYPAGSGGCDNGSLRFSVEPRDPAQMAAEIRALAPDGDTPTAEAMKQAVGDLKSAGYDHGTLVLVSDGESTCAGAIICMRSSAFRRLCAWRALVALARKRST